MSPPQLKNLPNNTRLIIMKKGGANLRGANSSMKKLHNNNNNLSKKRINYLKKILNMKQKRVTNLKNNIREKIHNAGETKNIIKTSTRANVPPVLYEFHDNDINVSFKLYKNGLREELKDLQSQLNSYKKERVKLRKDIKDIKKFLLKSSKK